MTDLPYRSAPPRDRPSTRFGGPDPSTLRALRLCLSAEPHPGRPPCEKHRSEAERQLAVAEETTG